LRGVESFTDKGKKTDAAAALNSLVSTKKIVLVFDKSPFNYCGSRFVNDELEVVINPEKLYTNTENVVEYFPRWVDMGTIV
jgi:hypothetical protein